MLSWTASPGSVLGYHVYRSPTAGGVFTRLTTTPLAATATTYTDPAPLAGPSTYQVRALELRATASSSYYNLSQAAFASFGNAGPLPVTLTEFQAARLGPRAVLSWRTASETGSRGFGVEVSTDGHPYRPLGFVVSTAAGGSTSVPQSYRYADDEPVKTGLRYYRLRLEDASGQLAYAGPRVLAFDGPPAGLLAYPSAFERELRVELALPAAGPVRLRLLDALGRACWQEQYTGSAGPNRWVLALPPLPAGYYVLMADGPAGPQRQRLLRN